LLQDLGQIDDILVVNTIDNIRQIDDVIVIEVLLVYRLRIGLLAAVHNCPPLAMVDDKTPSWGRSGNPCLDRYVKPLRQVLLGLVRDAPG
jgi:hypothetical protein